MMISNCHTPNRNHRSLLLAGGEGFLSFPLLFEQLLQQRDTERWRKHTISHGGDIDRCDGAGCTWRCDFLL